MFLTTPKPDKPVQPPAPSESSEYKVYLLTKPIRKFMPIITIVAVFFFIVFWFSTR